VKSGRPLKSVTYPGRPDIGHAWAYLPDFAETIAQLVEREDALGTFASFHFGGHWFARGGDMAQRVREVAGAQEAPIRRLPWTALLVLSPFVRLFREMVELRYLWKVPVRLDNAKLRSVLGKEPHTEIDVALRRTLTALGCMAG
jgi:nucleoside-diphosphate-sugar epimerase